MEWIVLIFSIGECFSRITIIDKIRCHSLSMSMIVFNRSKNIFAAERAEIDIFFVTEIFILHGSLINNLILNEIKSSKK